MKDRIYIYPDDMEIVDASDYCEDIDGHFSSVPEIAKPLIKSAKLTLNKIEKMLYSTPAFINVVKASIPDEIYQAVFTDEQKSQIAQGALKLMSKKDGSLMANLINTETKKIVAAVPIKAVKVTPEISQAITSYSTQMQMAQISEEIQLIQAAVEEVRQGLEYDRLATAYSCQQKLLQAMVIKNQDLKSMALLRVVLDAEDSRNLLMQSQNVNLTFIKNQPDSFFKKLISGAAPEKINSRMNEIRESLYAVNMVSLSQAIAYQEMGEIEAAQQSLQYYAEYIQKTYLRTKGLVQRLDSIDPSPENYWSKTLPEIERKIKELPFNEEQKLLGDEDYDWKE
nr:hypothetical protein [uncultured Romboutsia sp.]